MACPREPDRTSLSVRDSLLQRSLSDRTTRVIARTLGGVQCCLAGVGEGKDRLTFPARFLVGYALNQHVQWIRFATDDELQQNEQYWRPLEFQPRCIIHKHGSVANNGEPIGMFGEEVQVLEQAPVLKFYDKPLIDVMEVPTPPTPPPR